MLAFFLFPFSTIFCLYASDILLYLFFVPISFPSSRFHRFIRGLCDWSPHKKLHRQATILSECWIQLLSALSCQVTIFANCKITLKNRKKMTPFQKKKGYQNIFVAFIWALVCLFFFFVYTKYLATFPHASSEEFTITLFETNTLSFRFFLEINLRTIDGKICQS